MTIAVAVKVHDGLVLAADSASTLIRSDPTGQSRAVVNVYNTANKVFNLNKRFPIGAVTWGSGSIGPASISTLVKDLRQRFAGEDPENDVDWKLERDAYTVEGVAQRLRTFMYEERYLPEFGGASVKPALSFLVAGYTPGKPLAEAYHIEIKEGGTCDEPELISASDDHEPMVYFEGQPEAINRLLAGYSEALPGVLRGDLGVPEDQIEPAMSLIDQALSTPLAEAAMPIQDAIELAEFLVNLTIGYTRFRPGAPTVGGPVEIAAITKHEDFKWVHRKHYFSENLNPGTSYERRADG